MGLYGFMRGRGELQTARELGEQLIPWPSACKTRLSSWLAHYAWGTIFTFLGELAPARPHFEQSHCPV